MLTIHFYENYQLVVPTIEELEYMVSMILQKYDIYGQWEQRIKYHKMVQILVTYIDLLISIQIIQQEVQWQVVTKQYGHKMVLQMLQLVQMSGQVESIDQMESPSLMGALMLFEIEFNKILLIVQKSKTTL